MSDADEVRASESEAARRQRNTTEDAVLVASCCLVPSVVLWSLVGLAVARWLGLL